MCVDLLQIVIVSLYVDPTEYVLVKTKKGLDIQQDIIQKMITVGNV